VAVLDDYQGVALEVADWSVLGARAGIEVFTDHLTELDALAERLKPFEVIVVMRERTPFGRDLLSRLPRLALLVSTGMRNAVIDLDAAAELGVTVCGTGMVGSSTVELAWALIMAVARDLTGEDRRTRLGQWQQTVPLQLAGSTLGILGLGRLGARIASLAKAFDMNVIAWSQHLSAAAAAAHGVERVAKAELFRRSDIVSVHLVLSDRTRGLVGAEELAQLGPDGFLVNTSRGPIVDEAALVRALTDGTIGGAALDVFDVEPLPAGHPLLSTPRTILSPHVGFVSRPAYEVAYGDAVQDIAGWLDGNPVRVLTRPT
jgi:phosphoglycerate dehydrogenase-like enzyme